MTRLNKSTREQTFSARANPGSVDFWELGEGRDEVSHNVPSLQIHKMHLTTAKDLTQLPQKELMRRKPKK